MVTSDRADTWPLSAAQQDIWYGQKLDPSSPLFHQSTVVRIAGHIDRVVFERAVSRVVAEVESFRVRFTEHDDVPRQYLADLQDWAMHYVDLSDSDSPVRALEKWIDDDLDTGVDLLDPEQELFKEVLFKLGDDDFAWYQRVHHILVDAYGLALIMNRLPQIYDALLAGTDPTEGALEGGVRRYFDDEALYGQSDQYDADVQYWQRLNDIAESASMSYRRVTSPKTTRLTVSEIVPADVVRRLDAAYEHYRVGHSRFLIAAAGIYVHRMTGLREVVVGMPVASGTRGRDMRTPHMAAKVLPLRLAVEPNSTAAELLGETDREVRNAVGHRGISTTELRRLSTTESGAPLAAANVNIIAFAPRLTFGGLPTTCTYPATGPIGELTFNFYAQNNSGVKTYELVAAVNPHKYSAEEARLHARRMVRVIAAIASDPHALVGDIELLDDDRRAFVLGCGTGPHRGERNANFVLDQFRAHVAAHPDMIAVACGRSQITYAELDARADALAARLADAVGVESVVGLVIPRSNELIVGMLATWKLGAAYTIIDPDLPSERIASVLAGTGVRQIVSLPGWADAHSGEYGIAVVEVPAEAPLESAPHHFSRTDLGDRTGYVIYTSGSTGRPKPTLVPMRGIANNVQWYRDELALDTGDGVVVALSSSFDGAQKDIWAPLTAGGTVYLAPPGFEPAEILRIIDTKNIAAIHLTPSVFELVAETDTGGVLNKVRTVLTGGEPMSQRRLQPLRAAGVRIVNVYGPTEASDIVAHHTLRAADADRETVPVGVPNPNVNLFVLDGRMHLAPVGAIGELYIGGIGVGRGYGGNAGLSALRFVANPFGDPGSRLYRTGDRVRWNHDRKLEYLGRADDQVKVRGFRIEPREIEEVILADAAVTQAAVVVREDQPGDKQLVGYVVRSADSDRDIADFDDALRTRVKQQLPSYMVPSAIVVLEALPLNVNGKLDRRALPQPTRVSGTGRGPRSAEEQTLCDLFADVLGLPAVDIDDDFFELGGHSLLATRLANRARSALGRDVTIRNIFDAPTPAALVAVTASPISATSATESDEHPDEPVSEALPLDDDERTRLLAFGTGPVTDTPSGSLIDEFQAQAARDPGATALVSGAEHMSYGELDARATALAARLASYGIGVESIVPLMMPRCWELVVGMLAVWKLGAAYMPVDTDLPPKRLRFLLNDTGAGPIVVRRGWDADAYARMTLDVVVIDADAPTQVPPTIPRIAVTADAAEKRIGYVISTSGSTGRPKPTLVPMRGIANTVRWFRDELALTPGSRTLAALRPSFDGAQKDIWAPLTAGGAIYFAPTTFDPWAMLHIIDDNDVQATTLTPSAFDTLLDLDTNGVLAAMQTICLGGEPMVQRRLHPLREAGVRVVNIYGPTEASDVCTRHVLTAADVTLGSVPIGSPIPNDVIFVLDSHMQLVPQGSVGELYVSGPAVARCYAGMPKETAARFLANPFGPPGTRLYRTGDRVRWNHDGELEYLGRTESYVKLRGFRIEPSEVRAVILDEPHIAQAVVVVREDRPGVKQLVAYVKPSGIGDVDVRRLRSNVAQYVPNYMVPAIFVVLDEMPLTRSGKVDVRALPEPKVISGSGRGPRNSEEKLLCELFAEALGLPEISIDDNFFELGGHSLLATRVANRARTALGREITVEHILNAPTPATLLPTLTETGRARIPLIARTRGDRAPMSFAQQRLLFLSEWGGSTYHIPITYRLQGRVDRQALASALDDVVTRHEALRTVFHDEADGSTSQVVLPATAQPVPFAWDTTTHDMLADEVDATVRREFDLARELPIRARLLELGPAEAVLVLVVHHIVCDGWSVMPLVRDISVAYNARLRHEPPAAIPLPVQYADYTMWQHEILGDESDPSSSIAREKQWWRRRLDGLPEELALPFDRRRGQSAGSPGDLVTVDIPADLHAELVRLTTKTGTTLFMVLQAALTTLLSRVTGSSDIPLGTVVAGRDDDALDDVVGFFVNTLVLRADLSGAPTVRELLAQVRSDDLDVFEHQQLPFEKLVEILNPPRSIARHPLFQTMLVLQNNLAPSMRMDGIVGAEYTQVYDDSAKFDQLFTVFEHRDATGAPAGLTCNIHYNSDLFDRSTIESAGTWLTRVLAAMTADLDQAVNRIAILDSGEREQMIARGRGSGTEHRDSWRVLPVVFEERVASNGAALAVGDGRSSLTYSDLNEAANRLAHLLIGLGVGPEQRVALLLDRSVDLVVAVLGVLKAGGTYVPMDPSNPGDHIAYVIGDSQPQCVLTTSNHAAVVAQLDTPTVVLDDAATVSQLADQPTGNPVDTDRAAPLSPLNTAYIIYTSGSTGRPKGVAIPHHNVLRLFTATEGWFGFGPSDVWTLFHSYAFDFSVWELWGPLLYGGRLVIVPFDVSRSPTQFLRLLVDEKVTVLNQTPSAFYQLVDADRDAGSNDPDELALRWVIFGGEALDPARLAPWWSRHELGRPVLVNMYGITETTVHVTFAELGPDAFDGIGIAIPDLDVYVLDSALQPTPVGVVGELYVGGEGLARGYAGRPGLSASRFIANPLGPNGSRMYRSGDTARWRSDGSLEFVGRADDQVKIRGFRIEPREIEAVILAHPGVAQTVVLVREDRADDKQLVAYVVGRPSTDLDGDDVRAHARAHLPPYMVPAAVVVLDTLPLTINGKLDRRALPAPSRIGATSQRTARTPEERVMCELFAEVLGVARVGVDDNFFDLGGHSLLATKLANRARVILGRDVSIRNIFDAPTPGMLSASEDAAGGLFDVVQRLRPGTGQQPPLFCIHPGAGVSWCYSALNTHLPRGQALWGIQARGLDDRETPLPQSIAEMAEDYLAQIRLIQPEGPYRLLGWSFGGVVSHTIASILESQGEVVDQLLLLDCPPGSPADAGIRTEDADALTDAAIDEFAHANAELWGALFAPGDGQADLEALRRVVANNVRLLKNFRPRHYDGDLVFVTAAYGTNGRPPLSAAMWADHVGGHITEITVDCGHHDMLQPEPSAVIGRMLSATLYPTTG